MGTPEPHHHHPVTVTMGTQLDTSATKQLLTDREGKTENGAVQNLSVRKRYVCTPAFMVAFQKGRWFHKADSARGPGRGAADGEPESPHLRLKEMACLCLQFPTSEPHREPGHAVPRFLAEHSLPHQPRLLLTASLGGFRVISEFLSTCVL